MLKNEIKVSIIILNWNGWKDTIECLESLYRITYSNYDVVVVDNASEDGSIKKIREYSEGKIKVESKFFKYDRSNKPIKIIEYLREESVTGGKEFELKNIESKNKLILIKNEKNYGFAEGNNISIKYAVKFLNSDYILLLNNDTVVDKNFLNKMVDAGEHDKSNGIVGPKIYYYDYKGKTNVINFTGADLIIWKGKEIRYGFKEEDRGQFNNEMEIDKIEGSCMLIKTKLIKKIGLFDPRYFTYWEETDFCYRTSKSGYKIIYAPDAKIWHKIAASSGGEFSNTKIYYITRNMLLFIKKNSTTYDKIKFSIYFIFYYSWFKAMEYLLYHHDVKKFFSYLKGIKDGVHINL